MAHKKLSIASYSFSNDEGDMFQKQKAPCAPMKSLSGFLGTVSFVLSLSVLSSSAYAGFEWVAPTPTMAPSQPSVTSYPPSQSSSAMSAPEVISPVIISGDSGNTMRAPAPAPYAAPVPLTPSPSTYGQQQVAKPNLATATIPVSPSTGGDIVQGFGAQIPLALALRQILPTGYNFSIDQDVDMDTSVSYRGGKNWRDTVKDMLASVGLVGREQPGLLVVSHMSAQAAPSAPSDMGQQVVIDTAPPPSLQAQSIGQLSMGSPHMVDVPAINVGSGEGWSAEHGETLHKVLETWCRRQGVELQWMAEYDYPVEASAHFTGSFEDAVRNLLAGFETARPQPIGELHSNASAGQMVLVITPRGNNYSN